MQGSVPGCKPVCVLTYPTLSDPANAGSSELELADLSRYELTLNKNLARSELLTLTEAEAELLATGGKTPFKTLAALGAKVSGKSVLFNNPTEVYLEVDTGIAEVDLTGVLLSYRIAGQWPPIGIRVAPNGLQCSAYDAAGRTVLFFGVAAEDEEGGVNFKILIVVALVALALAAVAVRGVRAVRRGQEP